MSDPQRTFVYSPHYYCDIGQHVFPMSKFERIYQALLDDGDIPANRFLVPQPASADTVRLAHTKEYVEDMIELRLTERTLPSELPLSKDIVRSYFFAAGGTLTARIDSEEAGAAGLQLVGPAGFVVADGEDGPNGGVVASAGLEAAGDLWVRDWLVDGELAHYTLTTEQAGCGEQPRDDVFEDNDTLDDAAPLPPASTAGS